MDGGLNLIANLLEIGFAGMVTAALYIFFRQKGNTVAEAGVYALMAMLMLHSWAAQVLLYLGIPHVVTGIKWILTAASAAWLWRRQRLLRGQIGVWPRFARAHKVAAGSMLSAWGCLAGVWLWRAADARPAGALPTPEHIDGIFQAARFYGASSAPVWNHIIFAAPWEPVLTPGVANLSAYAAIALATYALARRYAWPPAAVTVSLLVIGMPRLVHQSLMPCSEVLPAAAVLAAILCLYRTLEQPHGRDVAMLISTVSFAVSGGRLCYAMPLILAALSLLVLGRRHDIRLWPQAIRGKLAMMAMMVAPALIFSQAVTVALNLDAGRSWIGERMADRIVFNADGLTGLTANMVRYVTQSMQIPHQIDRLVQWSLGFSGSGALQQLYHLLVEPFVGGRGAAVAFDLSRAAIAGGVWFGPIMGVLLWPSLINAFLRGPRRLKTTAMALAAYWMLICLVAAWQPSNVYLMTPLFAAAGFTMAFFLPPWRLGRKGRLMLQLLAVMLLGGAILP